MQPVGELDQQDADVVGDGQQKLAEVLGLLGLLGDEIEPLILVRPSTSAPISGPNRLIDLLAGRLGVLDRVVQDRGDDGGVVELRSVRIAATSSGWEKKGSPEARFCAPCACMA